MLGRIRSYILFSYLKYILINVTIFISLIWISQILRILEIQSSINTQMFTVIGTTMLVLPSFISPLMPFLLILASFFLNYKFTQSNEIFILKQYFSIKKNLYMFILLFLSIFTFYFINNEYLSVKLYEKYKVQELEIRNNLKLGIPSKNEFHIEEQVSIFFQKQKNNNFHGVEAIIYNEGQFIRSDNAKIEIDKKNYNIIFNNGERIILNENEKSKTIFNKFIYSIKDKDIEELTFDKEHFNTLQLLKKNDQQFYYQAHNRIYQYFLTIVIVLLSFKIFFFYVSKKNILGYYFFLFFLLLILQLINSYLLFQLKNNNLLTFYYYLINFTILTIFTSIIFYKNENN